MDGSFDPIALRRARLSTGLTQERLAARIGVAGPTRISLWESGAEEPHPSQLRGLSEVLGVSIPSLLIDVGPEGRDLRRLRIEAGLTTDELAAASFVATPTLKRWERRLVRGLESKAPTAQLVAALGVPEADVTAALRLSSRS